MLQNDLDPKKISLHCIIIYSYFSQEDEGSKNLSLSIMRDLLKKNDIDIENRALNAIMKLVCEDNLQKEFLGCLYQFLKDPDPEMRISFSLCLSSLMENNLSNDKDIVPKLIIPAVLSLSVDLEPEVQVSCVKPLVTLFSLEYLEFEEKERASCQVEALLRSENEMVICNISSEITEVLPSLLEEEQALLIPIICKVPHVIKQQKKTFQLDNLKTLIKMFRTVSQMNISDYLVSADLVHSLFEMLEIVTQQDPRCVPDIQQIISEVQEGIPSQSENAEEDCNENDKLSTPGKVKERVNKLFQKQGTIPFWKK
jgi:hypothetical protein